MPAPFSRSIRSLNADTYSRPRLGLLCLTVILAAWLSWFFMTRLALCVVSDKARLEVDRVAHPIETAISGRIQKTHLTLDREVKVGEGLVEIKADAQQLQSNEEQARVAALSSQLAALRDQLRATQQAQTETQRSSPVALDELRAKFREADAVAQSADEEAKRLARLHSEGLISELDLLRAKAEAQKRQAAAESIRIAISRLDAELRARDHQQQSQLEEIKSKMASTEGEIRTKRSTIERLQYEIDRRVIRAPTSGRLAEIANLQIGQFLREGDKLGTILPVSALRIVAEYDPGAAMGRVKTGQRAWLWLEGFSWAEYGKIAATVSSVASEPRSGQLRIELAVNVDSAACLPGCCRW
jgi:membrane fusion protein (multidrug efflux system)